MFLILTNASTNATVSIEVISDMTFANLKQCAMTLVDTSNSINNCLLKYVDSDGDEVTIASDVDLVEALSFMKEVEMETMRVLVKPNRSFPPTSMQQQVLNMVAAVGAFAKQVENDVLIDTKTNAPTVREVFERMHHALSEWQVSEDAKAIQFLKPDLLEVLSSAQLIQTIELLSTTTQYAPLVNAVLQAVSAQEPIESVLVAHWEDVVDFTHEVLKQCQEVALHMLLIRIAKTCAAGVAEYNKHASPKEEEEEVCEQVEEKEKEDEDKTECTVIHVNYRCDGCQTSPIVGPRYRSIQDDNFDLCETCRTSGTYDTLGLFETIVDYRPIHFGIICDGCEMSPIVGTCYKSFATNDFDLCETCEAKERFSTHEPFIKIKHPDQAPGRIQVVDVNVGEAPIIHPFVVCDGCEMSPIVGKRFKSTTTDDFDLCGKCHSAGTWNGSHGPFAEIERPGELRSWKRGVSKTDGHHPVHSRGRHHCIPIRAPDSFTVGDVKVASDASVPQQQSQRFGCRRFVPRERDNTEALCAAFEGDVTIPDGTIVPPEAELMKAWKVKNSGERAWPEGCMLKMQTGRFGVIPFDGEYALMNVAVPPLNPGEEAEVGVQLIAPTQPDRYRAYWRMCNPEGVCFGHRFWIDVMVCEEVTFPVEIAIDTVAVESVSEIDQIIEESTSLDVEAVVDGSDASTVELEEQAASSSESEGSSFFDVESDGSQSCDDVESVGSLSSNDETSDESEDEESYTVQQPILVETEVDEANLKELYDDALSVLEAMGFGDKEHNRQVLSELGGDLMDAIHNLLIE